MSFGSSEWQEWVINEDKVTLFHYRSLLCTYVVLKAMPLLKAAWDRGVNTFDTANVYSNGESEKILAKFIKTYNIPREKIIILTKCYFLVGDTPGLFVGFRGDELAKSRDYVNQSRLSRAAIFNAVEKSLERLETPYIDLLQIHRYDGETPAEETMCALNDLVRSGKVRYIGASSMWAWQFAEYNHVAEKNGWTQFVSMQNQYSLIYREEEREMIPYCLNKGIGLIPWAPLAEGHLARPVKSEETKRMQTSLFKRTPTDADNVIIARVEALAKKYNVPMAQIAMAWIMIKATSPIIGMSSPARLEDAIIGDLSLTPEEIKSLEEPYAVRAISGHV
ncbi:hypothetical protein FRB95_000880 [Tulasnella sp. JGI-2019a]|nr:hypothetical protein FRB95_000880 [Tulasnella sp. JGI-2019a]